MIARKGYVCCKCDKVVLINRGSLSKIRRFRKHLCKDCKKKLTGAEE